LFIWSSGHLVIWWREFGHWLIWSFIWPSVHLRIYLVIGHRLIWSFDEKSTLPNELVLEPNHQFRAAEQVSGAN